MPSEAATAVAGGCGPAYGASRSANQRPRSARSGSGIPSSSQITVNGSGNAKPATRSTGLVRAAGRQVGEQVVHDRPDPGLQRGDPPSG